MSRTQAHNLGARLRDLIASEGPMPLEHFMAHALGDPAQGYYMTRDPLGAAGDFITAPEISQMFGELLGLWAAESWAQMGAPQVVHLVELGPGRGTLMADTLRAAKVAPKFLAAIDVHLVETSPVLRDSQRRLLEGTGVNVAWHETLSDLPNGPLIVVANEFFDALPVRHYVRMPTGWHERMVGLGADNALVFGVAAQSEPSIVTEAPQGAVLEVAAVGHRTMQELSARIAAQGGAALVIDYGYAQSRVGETLQALKAHKAVEPLAEPGEADLTTHVDFSALARAAHRAGLQAFGPVGQGEFLHRLGIEARATSLKRRATPEQAAAIDLALARLTRRSPEPGAGAEPAPGMGSLFKVLCVAPQSLGVPAGFRPDEMIGS